MSELQLECEVDNAQHVPRETRSSAPCPRDSPRVSSPGFWSAMASNLRLSTSIHLPVAIGDLIAGKYEVERVLGEGGMGVVLAAHHRELDRKVAIKLLLPELAAVGMAAERFRREARASARIRGEHVCQVIDVGSLDNGVPYMVMEYLEGHDLATELELRGKLPYAEAVSYVLQACDAVAAAHAEGVIHRDLKPANLFLERCADGSRRIKVLDFGVSKSLLETHSGASALTQTSNLLGSPLYMSPEQLDSAKGADARSDIWSLGVVLYELISGKTPFDGESIAQLVTAVLQATPRSLHEHTPDVPAQLEAVVERTLRRPREERFRNVAELALALKPFAARQPALQHVARMSSLQPPRLSSQPGAASHGAHDDPDDENQGGDGGEPKRPRWVWLGVALVAALLALLGQRWIQRGGLLHNAEAAEQPQPSAAEAETQASAKTPEPEWAPAGSEPADMLPSSQKPAPTDLALTERAAAEPTPAAPPAALDAVTELSAATNPDVPAAALDAAVGVPAPATAPDSRTAPPVRPPTTPARAAPTAARAAKAPINAHSSSKAYAPPVSDFGGRR